MDMRTPRTIEPVDNPALDHLVMSYQILQMDGRISEQMLLPDFFHSIGFDTEDPPFGIDSKVLLDRGYQYFCVDDYDIDRAATDYGYWLEKVRESDPRVEDNDQTREDYESYFIPAVKARNDLLDKYHDQVVVDKRRGSRFEVRRLLTEGWYVIAYGVSPDTGRSFSHLLYDVTDNDCFQAYAPQYGYRVISADDAENLYSSFYKITAIKAPGV